MKMKKDTIRKTIGVILIVLMFAGVFYMMAYKPKGTTMREYVTGEEVEHGVPGTSASGMSTSGKVWIHCEQMRKPYVYHHRVYDNYTLQQQWEDGWDDMVDDLWDRWQHAYRNQDKPVCGVNGEDYENPYTACLRSNMYHMGAC